LGRAPSISFALALIIAPPKGEECLKRVEKPTETLAKQAISPFVALRPFLD